MSDPVFPSLPGLAYPIGRRPQFKTRVQEAISGREVRAGYRAYPIWYFTHNYEFLRDTVSENELNKIQALFMDRRGQLSTFLYTDPDNYACTAHQFGTGDGTTAAFQLTRKITDGALSFVEPVENVNAITGIYRNDWQGNQLMYSTARTNLCLQSETQTSWTGENANATANTTVAPDGATTADTITADTATGRHGRHMVCASIAAGSVYTISAWIKKGTAQYVAVGDRGDSVWHLANVDLNAGTIKAAINCTATITAFSGGWYRVSCTFTRTTTGSGQPSVNILQTGLEVSPPSFAGAGTETVVAWGVQLEAGATMTSYIGPTVGSVVTRTDYALGSTGIVTFGSPVPLASAVLTWTGTYYNRCRFLSDEAEFERFMYQLWQLKKVQFKGSPGNKLA